MAYSVVRRSAPGGQPRLLPAICGKTAVRRRHDRGLSPDKALADGFPGVGAGYCAAMPNKRASVKNEKQYEGLKKKGMSKERAARIANSPGSSSRGGKKSGSSSSRSSSKQGGTTAQKKAAGRKGGRASARKS
jgi:hypothetical protein